MSFVENGFKSSFNPKGDEKLRSKLTSIFDLSRNVNFKPYISSFVQGVLGLHEL